MRFDIITCLPGLVSGFIEDSIIKRAREKTLLDIHIHDLRDFALNKYKQVDDYAYGGGAGMVLMMEPIVKCLEKLKEERKYNEIIYLSPDGTCFNQGMANRISLLENVILLCGHYKGVDERIRQHYITREISIGDYVLSGGEIAAAVIVDAVGRILPGVLSDESSALTDSYQDNLVGPPVYTRPADFEGLKVPDILLSGNEKAVEEWRFQQAVERTKTRRPDLLDEN